jgi:poly-gamma-glutamate capsule biosynthesis protein CapA/YwtB (metallophosphatase superfamily)
VIRVQAGRALIGPLVAVVLVVGCSTSNGPPSKAGQRSSSTESQAAPAATQRPDRRDPSAAAAGRGAGQRFTVAATGDVLVHDGVRIQARRDARVSGRGSGYDFLPTLAGTTPLIRSADLAICHLEVPLAPPGGPHLGYPLFYAPRQIAEALASQGYDTCSTASNHALDHGVRGVASTLAALDAAGIRHAGTARSAGEAAQPTILDVGGIRVAQLSYTYGFNGLGRPRGQRWIANAIDDGRIGADAAAARRAGADVVIASLHWGTELRHVPSTAQLSLARRLLASPDIDLIIGHHAHVVQPLEKIGDKWVAYGLGNLVASKSHNFAGGATREGIIVRFTFTRQPGERFRVTAVDVTPTYIDATSALRVLDTRAALANPRVAADPTRLRKARERTTRVVMSRGAAAHGLAIR